MMVSLHEMLVYWCQTYNASKSSPHTFKLQTPFLIPEAFHSVIKKYRYSENTLWSLIGQTLMTKNWFITCFLFFSLFWLLLNSFTNSSLAINPMSKEESNILTDPCRPLGKWLTSLIPYWSLLGWVAATLQRRPAGNGNSNLHNSQRVLASKLFGFYYTTNKEITKQNFSSCHYELVFELCICIDIILLVHTSKICWYWTLCWVSVTEIPHIKKH